MVETCFEATISLKISPYGNSPHIRARNISDVGSNNRQETGREREREYNTTMPQICENFRNGNCALAKKCFVSLLRYDLGKNWLRVEEKDVRGPLECWVMALQKKSEWGNIAFWLVEGLCRRCHSPEELVAVVDLVAMNQKPYKYSARASPSGLPLTFPKAPPPQRPPRN